MTIFALTVGRNEEHRYLKPMLQHMRGVVDLHFFYDDRSTDRTQAIAYGQHCITYQREADQPSFLDDEGAFREGAWRAFEAVCQPLIGDWILVIDCDEVLVGLQVGNEREITYSMLKFVCEEVGHGAVNLNIPEVFGFEDDGRPLVRTDRLWGTIHAPRLFSYRPAAHYARGLGSPAVPSYVQAGAWNTTSMLALMHYGYARSVDQVVKHDRYVGQAGHSNAHVDSILAPDKVLEPWRLPYIKGMGEVWIPSTS